MTLNPPIRPDSDIKVSQHKKAPKFVFFPVFSHEPITTTSKWNSQKDSRTTKSRQPKAKRMGIEREKIEGNSHWWVDLGFPWLHCNFENLPKCEKIERKRRGRREEREEWSPKINQDVVFK